MPVERLHGTPDPNAPPPKVSPAEFVAAVVRAAAERQSPAPTPRPSADPALACQFLCTLPPAMVPLKLAVVAERWKLAMRQPDGSRIILRREAPVELHKPGRGDSRPGAPLPPPSGYEVVVRRPLAPSAEFTVVGSCYGSPDEGFTQRAQKDLPSILDQIRGLLQNLAERRGDRRFATDDEVRVYPLYPDGVIGRPIPGRTRDVSAGGVRFFTPTPVRTERLFIEFPEVAAVAGLAVYARVLRASVDPGGEGAITVARFGTGN
jgi:hypothetical protein